MCQPGEDGLSQIRISFQAEMGLWGPGSVNFICERPTLQDTSQQQWESSKPGVAGALPGRMPSPRFWLACPTPWVGRGCLRELNAAGGHKDFFWCFLRHFNRAELLGQGWSWSILLCFPFPLQERCQDFCFKTFLLPPNAGMSLSSIGHQH